MLHHGLFFLLQSITKFLYSNGINDRLSLEFITYSKLTREKRHERKIRVENQRKVYLSIRIGTGYD